MLQHQSQDLENHNALLKGRLLGWITEVWLAYAMCCVHAEGGNKHTPRFALPRALPYANPDAPRAASFWQPLRPYKQRAGSRRNNFDTHRWEEDDSAAVSVFTAVSCALCVPRRPG